MPFTTWDAVIADAKDKIAAHVAGNPTIGSYEVNGYVMKYRSIDELFRIIELCQKMQALESSGTSARVSYGRHRRFRS